MRLHVAPIARARANATQPTLANRAVAYVNPSFSLAAGHRQNTLRIK